MKCNAENIDTKIANVQNMIDQMTEKIDRLVYQRRGLRALLRKYTEEKAEADKQNAREAESRAKYERAMRELEEFNNKRYAKQ